MTTVWPTEAPAGHGVYRTRGLGTRAELVLTDRRHLVAAARILDEGIERIDRVASRFRADSEVLALHRRAGQPVTVSPDLLEAITVAIRAAVMTGGAVDPTVGGALCRLGYDRDFAEVAGGASGELPVAEPVPGWERVLVDPGGGTVTVAPGVLLDLGATAKALAADRIAAEVVEHIGGGVLVSLGGDVAVAGDPPPAGFAVGVADGGGGVELRDGGLATSGVTVRRWSLGGEPVHHLVDPSTGLPVAPCWRTVSVAAASCVDANTASTGAMVKGAGAPAWLSDLGLPARLVGVDGSVILTGAWPEGPGPAGQGVQW